MEDEMATKSAQTRRGAITAALGLAATTAVGEMPASAYAAGSADDTTYTRPDPPRVSVTYPSSWDLATTLLTDLDDPKQAFAVSPATLTPAPSRDFTGLPDFRDLDPNASLLLLMFEPFSQDLAGGTSPISKLSFNDLDVRPDGPPGFVWRSQWYSSADWVYTLFLWIPVGQSDTSAEAAVVNQIVLV
jgi:hypothetical protein